MKPVKLTCGSCVNFCLNKCNLDVPDVTEDSSTCLEYLGDSLRLVEALPYEMTVNRPPEVGSVAVLLCGTCVQIAEVALTIKTVEGETLDLSDVVGWRVLRKIF